MHDSILWIFLVAVLAFLIGIAVGLSLELRKNKKRETMTNEFIDALERENHHVVRLANFAIFAVRRNSGHEIFISTEKIVDKTIYFLTDHKKIYNQKQATVEVGNGPYRYLDAINEVIRRSY